MGDSELKARRKLEEAEKKCRGGGGFLGKIFGGSSADEAADLFVQGCSKDFTNSDEDDPDEVNDPSSSDYDASIECDLCGRDFQDIVTFESHYKSAHSYECIVCMRMFVSQKALDVHSDETHCPFHRLRIEKDPDGNHFQCYDRDCMKSFATGTDRDIHCREQHNIENVLVTVERRKLARKLDELSDSIHHMSLLPKKKGNVPRAIRFGDQERSFEGVRRLRRTGIRETDT